MTENDSPVPAGAPHAADNVSDPVVHDVLEDVSGADLTQTDPPLVDPTLAETFDDDRITDGERSDAEDEARKDSEAEDGEDDDRNLDQLTELENGDVVANEDAPTPIEDEFGVFHPQFNPEIHTPDETGFVRNNTPSPGDPDFAYRQAPSAESVEAQGNSDSWNEAVPT